MSDSPAFDFPPEDETRLDPRNAEIHRVLAMEDPALAGLFLFLLRAMAEAGRPGGIHMLGHAGRELSLGVISYLAGGKRAAPEKDDVSCEPKEKYRITIARALRLSPDHPSVTAWFKAHTKLVSVAHYPKVRVTRPDSHTEVLAAANALIALLWSRTGPFFGAKEEIERLLALEVPTPSDITALNAALSRPAVRWEFFKRLEAPGWVKPLLEAGFFSHPPDLPPVDQDGKQRAEGWSEGEYLRRMAGKVPADVRDALLKVPETLRNPYVWDGAIEAAKLMPAAVAVTLVPLFRKAVVHSLPVLFPSTLGELAVLLAEAGREEAFVLARDVMRVTDGKTSPSALLEGTTRKEAALAGLDEYEAEELIPSLSAALETVDAEKALKFLMYRLDEAMSVEWADVEHEPSWNPSKYWCPDLHQAEGNHGFKEYLAVAIAGIASRAATRSSEDARRTLELLAAHRWSIYQRVKMYVLAQAGRNALQELIPLVCSVDLLREEYPLQEYLLLLKKQFHRADAPSRSIFSAALTDGPGTDEELRTLLTEDGVIPDDEQLRHFRIRWQRKRLRRFGDNIPLELQELASRLDADTSVPRPSGAELELEDTGSTGSMGWAGSPRSPLTSEEFAVLTPQAIIAYLGEYKASRVNFDSPTPAGLAIVLASRVREEPALAAELAALLPDAPIACTYVRAILQGLVGAADEGRSIPWTVVLPLVETVAHQINSTDAERVRDFDYGDPNWRWSQREAGKLTGRAARQNLAVLGDADALWRAAEALLFSTTAWEETDEPTSMDAALFASLNTVAGESVEAFVEVALWHFRLSQPKETASVEASSDVAIELPTFPIDRFRADIDALLLRSGGSAFVARVRLGEYLPQLLLIDRTGILERADDLFRGGFAPPVTNGVWGGYITRQELYNAVFKDLRPWYAKAADGLPAMDAAVLRATKNDSTWSPTRHLTRHCLIAVLRGLATPTDDDKLVQLVFERSAVSDRSHAYWGVFSSWKGPAGSVPPAMVERLLRFWEWRLEELRERSAAERKEEAGALGWLALVEVLSAHQVLPLLSRTAEYAGGHFPMEHSMWERIKSVAELDVDATITMVDRIIRAELADQYPHFNMSDIGPVLKVVLNSDDASSRQRATDLINLLGDNGFTEFGTLL